MFSLPKQQHFLLIAACLLSGIFIASAILFAQPGYARALGCGNADGPNGGRDPGDDISSCPDRYYCLDGKRYKQDMREREYGGGRSGWNWVRTAYAAGEGRRDVYDSGPSGGCVNDGPPVRVPSQDYLCAPASCTITANPSSITEGQSTKLTWDSLNATSCTSGDFTVPGGSVNGRTSDVIEPAVGSTKPYTITCTDGSDTDLDSVVTVAAPPPTVTTQVQSNVTQTGATLNGTANPNGTATTGWFRYRTSSPGSCNDSFGTRRPSSGGTSLGSGTSGVSFSRAISGLIQNTTYYYCAIAENAGGKAYGAVRSFTMTATASTCTLSVSPSTVNQPSGATLSWNSSNANWFHISSVRSEEHTSQ